MKRNIPTYSKLFSQLNSTVEAFIKEAVSKKPDIMATTKWTVKDVLCHIVFWHHYYSKQYAALAANKKPFIFTSKGGSTRNQEGVSSLKDKDIDELIKMLEIAQQSLHKSIVIKKVPEMDYTDRRKYKTEDFLDVVIGHIARHTLQIKKAK